MIFCLPWLVFCDLAKSTRKEGSSLIFNRSGGGTGASWLSQTFSCRGSSYSSTSSSSSRRLQRGSRVLCFLLENRQPTNFNGKKLMDARTFFSATFESRDTRGIRCTAPFAIEGEGLEDKLIRVSMRNLLLTFMHLMIVFFPCVLDKGTWSLNDTCPAKR